MSSTFHEPLPLWSGPYRQPPRLPFFPSPLPDEHLFSLIARYCRYAGRSGPVVRRDLFGDRRYSMRIERITSIGIFCSRVAEGVCSAENWVIGRLTLYNYLAAFMPERERDNLRRTFIATPDGRTGLKSNRMRLGFPQGHLRFCAACLDEDRSAAGLGSPYWRRSHQPGRARRGFMARKSPGKLDREQAQKVGEAARRIQALKPIQRVTRPEIARILGCSTLARRVAAARHWPQTSAAIDSVAESGEAYFRRRIRYIIDCVVAQGNEPATHAIESLSGSRTKRAIIEEVLAKSRSERGVGA